MPNSRRWAGLTRPPAGSGERVLFRSTNGAAATRAAAAPVLLIGSLRNARACADYLRGLLTSTAVPRVTVVACGSVTGARLARRGDAGSHRGGQRAHRGRPR